MMTEQRLQEIEAQHQRGLLHRADIDDLIVDARRLKQEMVKCQDIWSTTIAEGMESITELQQQRDAALAERDALYTAQMKQIDYSVQLQRLIESLSRDGDVPYPELHHHQKIVDAKAAITEARRVLRLALNEFEQFMPTVSGELITQIAAVLAQDESAD